MEGGFRYISKDYVISGSLIDLSDAERAWQALDKRVRTSIRKGERMGVKIRIFDGSTEELEALKAFTPNDDDIPSQWEDRHVGYVAVAEDTQERLGWILLAGVHGTTKLFMLCHASTSEGKRRQTPNLLLWHAIKMHSGKAHTHLDVGASYRPSLQNYFEGYRQQEYAMIMRPPELPIDLRITPFDTAAYGIESGDPDAGRNKLEQLFGTDNYTIFPRAMYAISGALKEYKLEGKLDEESEVLITTTTDTSYISGCVTRAIESVCKWSQTPSEKTAAVFLIHEFGWPHPEAPKWRAFCDEKKIPLIEDCAYGWGSEGTGKWGDVVIYSATKLFPVQFGGFLVGMKIPFERMWHEHGSSDLGKEDALLAQLDVQMEAIETIREKRRKIWKRYEKNLASISKPYFELREGVMPFTYLAKMHNEDEMRRVSAFVKRFGIEVGNWYHHSALFLPCHQRMTERHVDYICGAILANFRENCGIPKG